MLPRFAFAARPDRQTDQPGSVIGLDNIGLVRVAVGGDDASVVDMTRVGRSFPEERGEANGKHQTDSR